MVAVVAVVGSTPRRFSQLATYHPLLVLLSVARAQPVTVLLVPALLVQMVAPEEQLASLPVRAAGGPCTWRHLAVVVAVVVIRATLQQLTAEEVVVRDLSRQAVRLHPIRAPRVAGPTVRAPIPALQGQRGPAVAPVRQAVPAVAIVAEVPSMVAVVVGLLLQEPALQGLVAAPSTVLVAVAPVVV